MSIKILLNDIFEKISYLDKNVENPFIQEDNLNNPFSALFNRTYVWIDNNENENLK